MNQINSLASLGNDNLAKVLLSSVNSIPSTKTEIFNPPNYLFRIVSFNANLMGAYGVSNGQSTIIGAAENNYNSTAEETIESLSAKIENIGGAKSIEFITIDDLTKSVLVFTRDYIDKLLKKEEYIGNLILNYYNLWHLNKTGVRGSIGAERHNTVFKTFSKLEDQRLDESYIPIAVASKNLPIIHNHVVDMMEVSQLAPYLKKESAYAPTGKRVEGSICYWLPRLVAHEFIQEQEPHKVLARNVLDKLLREGGLYDTPPVRDFRPLNLDYLNTDEVKESINEMTAKKLGISTDFRIKDSGDTVRQNATIADTAIRKIPKLT